MQPNNGIDLYIMKINLKFELFNIVKSIIYKYKTYIYIYICSYHVPKKVFRSGKLLSEFISYKKF